MEGKKIGVLLGAFNSEDILRKNLKKYSIDKLKDFYALRNMLLTGRVNLLILSEPIGKELITKYPKNYIKKSEKAIFELTYYLALNNRYLKLKIPLENELKKT